MFFDVFRVSGILKTYLPLRFAFPKPEKHIIIIVFKGAGALCISYNSLNYSSEWFPKSARRRRVFFRIMPSKNAFFTCKTVFFKHFGGKISKIFGLRPKFSCTDPLFTPVYAMCSLQGDKNSRGEVKLTELG